MLDDILPEFKRHKRLDDEEALNQAKILSFFKLYKEHPMGYKGNHITINCFCLKIHEIFNPSPPKYFFKIF